MVMWGQSACCRQWRHLLGVVVAVLVVVASEVMEFSVVNAENADWVAEGEDGPFSLLVSVYCAHGIPAGNVDPAHLPNAKAKPTNAGVLACETMVKNVLSFTDAATTRVVVATPTGWLAQDAMEGGDLRRLHVTPFPVYIHRETHVPHLRAHMMNVGLMMDAWPTWTHVLFVHDGILFWRPGIENRVRSHWFGTRGDAVLRQYGSPYNDPDTALAMKDTAGFKRFFWWPKLRSDRDDSHVCNVALMDTIYRAGWAREVKNATFFKHWQFEHFLPGDGTGVFMPRLLASRLYRVLSDFAGPYLTQMESCTGDLASVVLPTYLKSVERREAQSKSDDRSSKPVFRLQSTPGLARNVRPLPRFCTPILGPEDVRKLKPDHSTYCVEPVCQSAVNAVCNEVSAPNLILRTSNAIAAAQDKHSHHHQRRQNTLAKS